MKLEGFISALLLFLIFFLSIVINFNAPVQDFCNNNEKDDCILTLVKESKNVSFCENSQNSSNCYLKSSFILNSSNLCEKLSKDIKNSCYLKWAKKTKIAKFCEKINGNSQEKCFFEVAIRSLNISICNLGKNPSQCIYSYAYDVNNSFLCEKSGKFVNLCYKRLKIKTN